MKTNGHILKNELLYRYVYVAVIFTAIITISISIYFTHNQWKENNRFETGNHLSPRIQPPSPQGWRLSLKNIGNKAEQPVNELQDPLGDVAVRGIVYSSDARASRAILREGGEQHSYALAEPLQSLPDFHIIAINKNQVTLSSNGKVHHLNFLPETPLPIR